MKSAYFSTSVLLSNILSIFLTVHLSAGQESPLFLTPYIQSGRIDEARTLSRVHNLSSTVISYSGLVTVDEVNGAHTFFWFFPAAENPENAPVVLWSEGGPGVSGLFSVFIEHGPFSIAPNGDINLREVTWTKNHSVIYVDQPMDVGYSFTENVAGHVAWGGEVGPNMYSFLTQFFKMFPEHQPNDFYCGGVSYGGIYAPTIAHHIHLKNQEDPEIRINLKGLLLETPWTDPISQVDYGDFLFHIGLIDEIARDHFNYESTIVKQLMIHESYAEAYDIFQQLIFAHIPEGSYYNNVTGLTDYYNFLRETDFDSSAVIPINEPNFRQYLHVGNLTFTWSSSLVFQSFGPKILLSVKLLVEDILNWNYRVLVYAGQLDIITSHVGVNKMITNLNWDGAEELANVPQKIWLVDNVVAGYTKTVRNFTQVLVRNAGHGSAEEQPARVFDLLNRFTQGIPF